MNINPVGKNQTEVTNSSGMIILYSYSTPVAAFIPGCGGLCTTKKHGSTTSRYINAAIKRWGCSRTDVDQSIIDGYATLQFVQFTAL